MTYFMGRSKKKRAVSSLRWELICEGAVRKYSDGREVCCDTVRGRAEYQRRMAIMIYRQSSLCSLGPHQLVKPTFEHSDGRGMAGSHRDDRIYDDSGKPMNSAACLACNIAKGSKRISAGQT